MHGYHRRETQRGHGTADRKDEDWRDILRDATSCSARRRESTCWRRVGASRRGSRRSRRGRRTDESERRGERRLACPCLSANRSFDYTASPRREHEHLTSIPTIAADLGSTPTLPVEMNGGGQEEEDSASEGSGIDVEILSQSNLKFRRKKVSQARYVFCTPGQRNNSRVSSCALVARARAGHWRARRM